MCDGLVCANGSCAACTETGARTCEGDLVCSPDGTCIDTDDVSAGAGGAGAGGASGAGGAGSGAGGAGGTMTPPGDVRGGAFNCSATPARRAMHALAAGPLLLALALLLRGRRSSREDRS
jgi:hypothetical protein